MHRNLQFKLIMRTDLRPSNRKIVRRNHPERTGYMPVLRQRSLDGFKDGYVHQDEPRADFFIE